MKALFLAMLLASANALHAQPYPARPVRIIVPFSPGAGTDIFARLIAKKLGESLPQPVVVENRVGAAGIIGCELVARAAPDGYTLLMGTTGSHTTNPAVYAKLPYDPLKDFAPISLVAEAPFILFVNPAVPARSVKELVALAKARPGELSFGSSGIGSSSHLGFELFNQMAGIRGIHLPY